ncbi:flagellar protein FliT [Propionivibrio sp.]|uniref:flagellar protein FliT n=1 Tax=Propionivibrio sp. TaxID=2212460 RepID=UPI0025F9812D|nr:flagellar protein FliT [Propionivibrio sp.]MBK7355560.1 flagellar protein FliT [Propionivibrio sp.]MBK8400770.1 flagellar protein FliT [Propionivibrio sp.]MBK8744796.1 flagellar protein FliT [Propionivibrio sp.]MBK8893224.1 flagellar protein FliT [Propionivibrio sp.]
MSVLERYQSATQLTRRMLEAARAQDWEALTAAGAARDALLEISPETLTSIPVQDRQPVARLIEEMLAFHNEITDHASPWLEHTATLLAAFDQANSTTLSMPAGSPETK